MLYKNFIHPLIQISSSSFENVSTLENFPIETSNLRLLIKTLTIKLISMWKVSLNSFPLLTPKIVSKIQSGLEAIKN